MLCPDCGHENPAEARFCGDCRSPIEQRGAATAKPLAALIAEARYAGFWRRLGALIIDIVLLWVITVLTTQIAFKLAYELLQLAFVLVWLAFPIIYYIFLTGLKGQTVGKMALRIKVVRADERTPGLGYATLPYVRLWGSSSRRSPFSWVSCGWHGIQKRGAGTTILREHGS